MRGNNREIDLGTDDRDKSLELIDAEIAAIFEEITALSTKLEAAQRSRSDMIRRRRNVVIVIASDSRCTCDCSMLCPLGRVGSTLRCTRDELLAAGVTVTGCGGVFGVGL